MELKAYEFSVRTYDGRIQICGRDREIQETDGEARVELTKPKGQ